MTGDAERARIEALEAQGLVVGGATEHSDPAAGEPDHIRRQREELDAMRRHAEEVARREVAAEGEREAMGPAPLDVDVSPIEWPGGDYHPAAGVCGGEHADGESKSQGDS